MRRGYCKFAFLDITINDKKNGYKNCDGWEKFTDLKRHELITSNHPLKLPWKNSVLFG